MERKQSRSNEGVIGAFRTRPEAERCIDALLNADFTKSQISVMMRGREESERLARETGVKETHAAEGGSSGAGAGAVLGGAAGLLAGLGLLAVPGIGPLLAMGPIATTLAGAGIGGVTGGVVGALIGLGIPENEAKRYEEDVRGGNILVTVQCDGSCDRARSILTSYAAFDVGEYKSAHPEQTSTRSHEPEDRPERHRRGTEDRPRKH